MVKLVRYVDAASRGRGCMEAAGVLRLQSKFKGRFFFCLLRRRRLCDRSLRFRPLLLSPPSLFLSLSLPSLEKPKQLPLQARPRDGPGRAQERLRGPGHRRRRRRGDEHAPEERQARAQGQARAGARVAVAARVAGPLRDPS